jgi:predicted XRE-type DNA-binding protein
MVMSKARKFAKARTAEELGRALRLSVSDTAEMEFRSDLTVALAKIIQSGRLTHADIAKRAGTSRTRVTAISNGNTQGVSTDVLIRVLAATGHRAEVRVKKTAASSLVDEASSVGRPRMLKTMNHVR